MNISSVIMGAGRMGRRHIDVLNKTQGYELKGVCDLSPDALRLARNEGAPAVYEDAEKMLDEIRPDFALVATTAPSHFSLAMLAIANGVKSLLVEKPFCISIFQAQELIKEAKRKGVKLAVNHGMRFDKHYMKIRDLLNNPDLGELKSVSIIGGNAGIAMNISHQLELFRLLSGEPLRHIRAWLLEDPHPNPRGPQFHDGAGRIMGENAKGQRFFADVSPDQGYGLQMICAARNGVINVDLLNRKARISVREKEYLNEPTFKYGLPARYEELDLPAPDDTHIRMLEALKNGENYTDGEAGKKVIEILAAVWASHENNHKNIDVLADPLPVYREFSWA